MRTSRREFVKYVAASGITLSLSRLGCAEQTSFEASQTLPGRQGWNPAVTGGGRIDGVAVMGGMLAGVFATGILFDRISAFYSSTARGAVTLPDLLGVSYGVVVCGIVLVALAGFRLSEVLERRFALPR